MSSFSLVSHEKFPEDPFIKELAYLLIEGGRVLYVRKQAKNGGLYWDIASVGVTKNGTKTYFETYMQDSLFLDKDIKRFLDSLTKDEEIPF